MKEKTKYDLLCDLLMDTLGCDFNIKYYLNSEFNWEDILTDSTKMVTGALLVQGGTTFKDGTAFGTFENLQLNIMIPSEIDFYTKSLNAIEEKLPQLNNHTYFAENGKIYTFTYNSRTDSNRTTIKGIEYAMMTINCGLMEYKNIILSKDRKVIITYTNNEGQTIDANLDGIINATFSVRKNIDGDVYGLDSPIQDNDVSGIYLQLDIDLIIIREDELHQKLLKEATQLFNYAVTYNNTIVERKMSMQLIELVESTPLGDKFQAKMTFAMGG